MDSGGEGKGELNDLTPRVSRPANIAIKPSPYQNLHDPPTPTGKLADRIRRLRDRCIDALGKSSFDKAYDFLIKYVSARYNLIQKNNISLLQLGRGGCG